MSDDKTKKPVGAEGGLVIEPTPKQQQQQPKEAGGKGNSDIQHLVQVLRESVLGSCKVSEARINARAPRVYLVGQNFNTWLSQFLE